MENNGAIYCVRCHLEIKRYDKCVRLPRPKVNRESQAFAHWHNRHSGDCWGKTVAEAEARKTAQMSFEFEKEVISNLYAS